MTPLTCDQVGRRLVAFHDGELPIEEQIAVEAHLHVCTTCADAAADLETIGEVMRARSAELAQMCFDDDAGLKAGVISRMKAEHDESVASRVGRLFEDLHFVYAGLGAAGATLACLLIMLGMMRFGARERPDSLAALVEVLAAPAETAPGTLAGTLNGYEMQNELYGSGRRSDAVFELSALVTHGGRLRNLDVIHPNGAGNQQAREEILNLMDTIRETQFQPIMYDGMTTPGDMGYAWRLHVTVRGKMPPVAAPSVPHASRKSADRLPVPTVASAIATI